jgi:lipopolysaccharide biosynthesis glycosyltransferase
METSNSLNIAASSTLEEEPIVVVCSADNNYALPLAVTMRSALENLNSSRKLLWFVIDGGISPRNKRRILKSLDSDRLTSEQLEIRWIAKPESIDDKFVISDRLPNLKMQHLPNSAYYRLLIPELLPDRLTKAIYLDCDIAVNASLEKLWDVEIGENYILAARNAYSRTVSHEPDGLMNWKELGFSADDRKFASGILVLNLEKWRSDNMCNKALDYLVNNLQYIRWHDSDVLHAIVKHQWGEVDVRWNFYKGRALTEEEANDAFIIHYISPEKPWIAIEKTPDRDVFFHYLRMTDWSGYKHTVPQRLWRRLKREVKTLQSKFR